MSPRPSEQQALLAGSNFVNTQACPVPNNTTPPSTPTGLTVQVGATDNELDLSWNASTDDSGIVWGYRVTREGNTITDVEDNLTFTDTGLFAGTEYSYTVLAYDLSNNISPESAPVAQTTSGSISTDPVYIDVISTGGATSTSTSLVLTLPTYSVGDLLICVFALDGAAGNAQMAGWTRESATARTSVELFIFTRVADGTEGTTATVTWTGLEKGSSTIWSFRNTSNLVQFSIANGGSVNPTFSSLSGLAPNNLIIAGCAADAKAFVTAGSANMTYFDANTQGSAGWACQEVQH